jgi:hypothetical protein
MLTVQCQCPTTRSRPIRTIYSGDSKVVNSELLEQFASLSTETPAVSEGIEAPGTSQRSPGDSWEAIRGAGIAPLLHSECKQRSVPFVAWIMACAEGNNVPDAVALATELVRYLALLPAEQKPLPVPFSLPPSWSQLFGRRPDVSLYL